MKKLPRDGEKGSETVRVEKSVFDGYLHTKWFL